MSEDDRIVCRDCRMLGGDGMCAAIIYHPARNQPRRCEYYKPLPGIADQRTGAQRGWTLATFSGIVLPG